jgi:hypothetical protein
MTRLYEKRRKIHPQGDEAREAEPVHQYPGRNRFGAQDPRTPEAGLENRKEKNHCHRLEKISREKTCSLATAVLTRHVL